MGQQRRVDLAGAAHLELVSGVAQLRPEDAMVEAMLRGWAAQQAARGLREDTISARERLVRQFAEFEVEEQTGISQILNEMMPAPPPPPSPADRRMMQSLASMRGAEFDRMYLTGQLDGHRRLLAIQEAYLSQGRMPHHRHIAMLARGRILEHIRDVQNLQRMG